MNWNSVYYFLCMKFKLCQVSSICVIFEGFISLLELKILEIHSFLHFHPTYSDKLSWHCGYYFLFMIKFKYRQCFYALYPYGTYDTVTGNTQFSTKVEKIQFSALCPILFYIRSWNFVGDFLWTSDRIQVSSIVNFRQVLFNTPFWHKENGNTQFSIACCSYLSFFKTSNQVWVSSLYIKFCMSKIGNAVLCT